MKILMVTAEAVPFAKTGGLADMVSALSIALAEKGHDVKIVMPRYYKINRDNLEKLFHRIIRGSAAPYGVMGEKCKNALKAAGIVYCRSTVSTEKFSMPKDWLELPATCHHGNPRLMELADKFFVFDKPRAPQLFYVWGHSYEFDDGNNWDVIEKFAEKMSGHGDKIWYATNGEIYDYVEAYNRLVWSVGLDRVCNRPTALCPAKPSFSDFKHTYSAPPKNGGALLFYLIQRKRTIPATPERRIRKMGETLFPRRRR